MSLEELRAQIEDGIVFWGLERDGRLFGVMGIQDKGDEAQGHDAQGLPVEKTLGRHGGARIWSQQEINQRIVELAQAGLNVVRLKGGDPAVFARVAEEAETLVHHGIPYEIVPGITAALGVIRPCKPHVARRDHR